MTDYRVLIDSAKRQAEEDGDVEVVQAFESLSDVHAKLFTGVVEAIADGVLPLAQTAAGASLVNQDEIAEVIAMAASNVVHFLNELGNELVDAGGNG